MRKIFSLLILGIFLISFASAVCTVTFDGASYNPTETIEATMVCDSAAEKSQAYTLNWTYANGTVLETDTGTTPTTQGNNFFETYSIPTYLANETVNATLTGLNLEGTDFATISDLVGNRLIINSCQFKPLAFIGADFSVDCIVTDINDKKIDNAHCEVYATDTNDAPLQISEYTSDSYDGEFVSSGVLKPENIEEGTSYLAKILCHCESGDNKCWDEDGSAIENYQGSITISFTTAQWLTVNTLVDMNEYQGRQVATICANVTNVDSTSRIPLDIYYQLRCGEDNDDTDRVVIASNERLQPDKRGISASTTQNQCWGLIVPEKRWMQGRTNICYASTEVWVLNDRDERIKGYFTTSPTFNITVNDLGVNPDWIVSGEDRSYLSTKINLSDDKYDDYKANLIGNLDVRLDLNTPEYTDSYTDSTRDGIIIFDQFISIQEISSINSSYCNGTSLDNYLEVTNEGFVEIEIRDLNLTTACVEVNVSFETFEERQTEALEGINNSAGTFDFSIVVPSTSSDDVYVAGAGLTGDGRILNRDLTVKCQVDGYPETFTQFEVYATSTFAFSQRVTNIPKKIQTYTMRCTVIDNFFGEDAVQSVANFNRVEFPEESDGGLRPQTITEIIEDIKTKEPGEDKTTETIFWLVVSLLIVAIVFAIWWFLGRDRDKK